jgi:hypothetical protein
MHVFALRCTRTRGCARFVDHTSTPIASRTRQDFVTRYTHRCMPSSRATSSSDSRILACCAMCKLPIVQGCCIAGASCDCCERAVCEACTYAHDCGAELARRHVTCTAHAAVMAPFDGACPLDECARCHPACSVCATRLRHVVGGGAGDAGAEFPQRSLLVTLEPLDIMCVMCPTCWGATCVQAASERFTAVYNALPTTPGSWSHPQPAVAGSCLGTYPS